MLDFASHFEYNIYHERIYKATMVNSRAYGVEKALYIYVHGALSQRTARSHGKLNTQTSGVPT